MPRVAALMAEFTTFAFTPAGLCNADLAIAACRAGGVGIVNGEMQADSGPARRALDTLAGAVGSAYGIKLDSIDADMAAALRAHGQGGLRWLIIDAGLVSAQRELLQELRLAGAKVLAEVVTPHWPAAGLETLVDGLLLKGNEAGGFVGENASFILLQKWRSQTQLPLYIRGGLTPHSAAACSAVGVAGGVLDSQLLMLDEARLPGSLQALLANLSGSETVAVGDGEQGEYFRLLVRPGHDAAREFVTLGEGLGHAALRDLVLGRADWSQPRQSLLPIGQDVAFAAPWRTQYRHLGAILKAIDAAVEGHLRMAVEHRPVAEDAPLARALGLRYPLVQGPMTRVSDTAEFALSVAQGGALPMVAFALLNGAPLDALLDRTTKLLGDRHWGIGLLGFAPQSLLDEQLAIAIKYRPDYAIIAGGRPDQAVHLEQAGVPTFLHVPAAKLIPMFLREGARRFIFEGRECGGHIGPLSSFVLWSSMVDQLLAELAPGKIDAGGIQLLFAGGVHDAVSSAMVQVLAAPLAARGVKIGILMGSAYLFTREIVASGAIVPQFQREVLDCERTINLESGPGHASRCAHTPFAGEYLKKRIELRERQVPGDEARQVLDQLILGRLRIASKGRARDAGGTLQQLPVEEQRREGMYMLGQVATLRA
jgi:NAD(P)H-dependent flavin oxidoreductase YrpB (nitropropane dioxygenase family)